MAGVSTERKASMPKIKNAIDAQKLLKEMKLDNLFDPASNNIMYFKS